MVLPSAPVAIRNHDVEHEYRQDSDLFYTTGFEEPECVLVLDGKNGESTLFVRPRDAAREIWDGPRAGVRGAVSRFRMDKSFPMDELDKKLPELLQNHGTVHYRIGHSRAWDERVSRLMDRLRQKQRLGVMAPHTVCDPGKILHEMRLHKRPEEVASMRRAARISNEAHRAAMRVGKPGRAEYEVEAAMLEVFRRNGSDRPAYSSIVGSGPNACILHYRAGKRVIQKGELVLVDAGSEFDCYASDITRTFPASGEFSYEQQAIYEIVLAAQEASIAEVRTGRTLDEIHEAGLSVILRGLRKLKLLRGTEAHIRKKETYKRFFMHRTSHWLGLDVHDAGNYFVDGKPRKVAPGMVLTVEPGIYIAKDAKVPAGFRGIGIRIEDDILVKERGIENLTEKTPKSVEDVRKACKATG